MASFPRGEDPDLAEVRSASRGNRAAWERIVRKYIRILSPYVFKLCNHNHADAEDALQETFFRAEKALSTFNGESAFRTWLYAIAKNYVWNERKKNRDRREKLEASHADATSEIFNERIDDRFDRILLAIEDLPIKQQTAINMFYREKKSISEVSDGMGESQQNIKVLLHRGRLAIQKYLGLKNGEQDDA